MYYHGGGGGKLWKLLSLTAQILILVYLFRPFIYTTVISQQIKCSELYNSFQKWILLHNSVHCSSQNDNSNSAILYTSRSVRPQCRWLDGHLFRDIIYCTLLHSQLTQNICVTFVQRRTNVFDVGPTLYNVMQMSCGYWARRLHVWLEMYQYFSRAELAVVSTRTVAQCKLFGVLHTFYSYTKLVTIKNKMLHMINVLSCLNSVCSVFLSVLHSSNYPMFVSRIAIFLSIICCK